MCKLFPLAGLCALQTEEGWEGHASGEVYVCTICWWQPMAVLCLPLFSVMCLWEGPGPESVVN